MKKLSFCRSIVLAVLLALSVVLCAGCSTTEPEADASSANGDAQASAVVNVGSLKGPTSIGLVNFIETAGQNPDTLQNTYEFSIYGTADELVPKLVNGELDIALIPANLAATLYNRTEGEILALDINTLGVLYVVSGDDSITDMQSLAGKTVIMTGKGTTPDYVFNYLLDQSGLSGQVTLEYKSEPTEVAALLAADPLAIAVLPEPFATAITTKDPRITYRISLTEVWDEVAEQLGEDSQLVTGVTVVRRDFSENHPEAVSEFVEQQTLSVERALSDPADTAELVVTYGILDDVQIAEKAIPRCNLTCITGEEMRQALEGYLQVLYSSNPESVGGSLPGADFYYR